MLRIRAGFRALSLKRFCSGCLESLGEDFLLHFGIDSGPSLLSEKDLLRIAAGVISIDAREARSNAFSCQPVHRTLVGLVGDRKFPFHQEETVLA